MVRLTAILALAGGACSSSPSSDTASTASPSATTIATTSPVSPTTTASTSIPASTSTSTSTSASAATTVPTSAAAAAYTNAGPHPVGVTTLQLAKGAKVEVWYPAVAGTTGTETYDVRDFTPDAIRKILTADIPAGYSYAAGRDAAVADGTFPVVLFSHGFTGIRVQSTFLTSHLASWGMIVAAPDHRSRDLFDVLGGTASGDRADSVDDLLKTFELVIGDGKLAPHADASKVAAVGHSAGGGTVLGAALDPRVKGYVSLASGAFLGDGGASTGATPTATSILPAKPSFFVGGSVDGVVPFATVTKPAYESAPSPSLSWEVDGVGHNGFDDFCTFGNGTGVIGIAEASGLGGLLDAQPQLRTLGQDGCIPPAVPVTTTFPIIRHAVTAWLRNLFGADPSPVGLGREVATAYPQGVTIEAK